MLVTCFLLTPVASCIFGFLWFGFYSGLLCLWLFCVCCLGLFVCSFFLGCLRV